MSRFIVILFTALLFEGAYSFLQKSLISKCRFKHLHVSLTTIDTEMNKIQYNKEKLKQILKAEDGKVTPEALKLIEELQEYNPSAKNGANSALSSFVEGNFELLSALDQKNCGCFGKDSDGYTRHSLGRIAFNMFQPTDLMCSIIRVDNPVSNEENNSNTFSYVTNVLFRFEDEETGNKVEANSVNYAVCKPSEKVVGRLDVTFLRGKLTPSHNATSQEKEIWMRVFGNQQPKTKPPLQERFSKLFAKLFMGLKLPSGVDESTGAVSYEMTRPPVGHLDIMYLDEDLRITKGNRETIIVAARQK
jgi:hypothetical protein